MRAGPLPQVTGELAGVLLGLERSSAARCPSMAVPAPSLVGRLMPGQGGSCRAADRVMEPGWGWHSLAGAASSCVPVSPALAGMERDPQPRTPAACPRDARGAAGAGWGMLASPHPSHSGWEYLGWGAQGRGIPDVGTGHPALVAGGEEAFPARISVLHSQGWRPLLSLAHPAFPAQVWLPGADPASGTGLPGGCGLLPGVARCHGAAAGPALARQRLRQPRAGRPPANPGRSRTWVRGGLGHPPWQGSAGRAG